MDRYSNEALGAVIDAQLSACRNLITRALEAGPYLAPTRPDFWDALFILVFYRKSLDFVPSSVRSGTSTLNWTSSLCSSLVDDAVYGRSLLNHALRIAVEAGLVASNNDARRLLELLNHTVQPRWCVVAYLDYVGASPNFRWQKFLALWRVLAKEANDWGFTGYYWRSSDSFYFFRSLADGEGADEKEPVCESFLKFLLYIQAKRCIPGDRWMWEIGVSLEKGTLVGDIFLPNGAPKAAKAMDVASDKLRGGGAIVATKKFRNSLSRISKRKMKALRGDNRELFYYDRLGVND